MDNRVEEVRSLDSVACSDAIAVVQLAARNCPWDGDLWIAFLEVLEKAINVEGQLDVFLQNFEDHVTAIKNEHISHVFESALGGGLSSIDDYRKVWMAYLDYHRRRVFLMSGLESVEKKPTSSEMNSLSQNAGELRQAFERAILVMDQYQADPYCEIVLYFARVEYGLFNNPEGGRKIIEEHLKRGFGKFGYLWNAYCCIEREYGDLKFCRSVFKRACQYSADSIDVLAQNWLNFERDFGTLQSYKLAKQRLTKKVEMLAPKEIFDVRHEQGRSKKRKSTEEQNMGSGGNGKQNTKKQRKHSVEKKVGENGDDIHQWVGEPGKEPQTVFVSNLALSVTEEDLDLFFRKNQGDVVEEIRLVKNIHGRSKGFAYVVLKSKVCWFMLP